MDTRDQKQAERTFFVDSTALPCLVSFWFLLAVHALVVCHGTFHQKYFRRQQLFFFKCCMLRPSFANLTVITTHPH